MKELYRPIYDKNPARLKAIYEQLCDQLFTTNEEDLTQICIDQNIDFLLNSLQAVKNGHNASQPAWFVN